MKLIHLASSYKMGLTNQETQLALAFSKVDDLQYLVVTGENEQFEGCFETLCNNNINNKIIYGFDEHHEPFRLIKEFNQIITEFNPDIVTVNTNWQLLITGLARLFSFKKFKIVYTIHGYRHNEKLKSYVARILIGGLLFLFSDAINAPTKFIRNKFKLLKYKIFVIPLGEDQIFFENSSTHDFSKPLNLVFPGVFRHGKNQELLIKAFKKFISSTHNCNTVLHLPGEGELKNQAQDLVRQLAIDKQVLFPGHLSRLQMLEVYAKCQIAIIPSNVETFGHCIAEPLVMQCIVISANTGLAPDFIQHGLNGFIFKDENDLVEILIKIKKMDVEQLQNIALAAKETGGNFKWPNIALRLFNEVYKPLLQ
ncbi:MAG: hypothetical protein RJB34_1252 [Pseudomonadota bacterium]|jgi:glycosyltransferase involved in cell wall biosynthesis